MSVSGKHLSLQKVSMILPGILMYGAFMLLPILLTGYYSFTNWDGIKSSWDFIGIENYIRTLADSQFLYTIRFTLTYTLIVTLISNIFGIVFAVLLQNGGKITNLYRSVFFLPLLISPIAAGFVWKALFSYTGIINEQLTTIFGIEPIMFLGNELLSKTIIMAFSLWQSIGFCMIIYLAGLQTVPKDLYDATSIDGATEWKKFWYVTFPFLAPATTSCVTFMFTGSMREYARVLVLTAGGPVGSTETVAYKIVTVGFNYNRLGYASAMAMWILAITAVISVLISRRLRKREDFLL